MWSWAARLKRRRRSLWTKAAAADDFAELNEIPGGDPNAGVEGEAIGFPLELEADPVVSRVGVGSQDHGLTR